MAKHHFPTGIIPSQRANRKYDENEETSTEESDTCEIELDTSKSGKWMLFLNKTTKDSRGLTSLDRAWISLVDLVNNGALVDLKYSISEGRSNDPNAGIIVCYTSDFKNKSKVKEAAKRIRDVVSYPYPMFYKTDIATESGVYQKFGHKHISLYKYTLDHELYQRGRNNEWYLVGD